MGLVFLPFAADFSYMYPDWMFSWIRSFTSWLNFCALKLTCVFWNSLVENLLSELFDDCYYLALYLVLRVEDSPALLNDILLAFGVAR